MIRKRITLVLVVLGVLAFGLVVGRKVSTRLEHLEAVAQEGKVRAGQKPQRPAPQLVQPTPAPEVETLRLTGSLRPEAEVDLGFKIPGRVVEILVQRGDVVQAGQVLARVDGKDIEAQAAQVRAGMQAARAQKAMAEDALKRSRNLQQAGAASEQQVAMADSQANLGSASIAQAQASGQLVDTLRLETKLVAPIDGVVVRAPTAAGFLAAPGVPLFRIEKLTNLRFHGHLTERDAARVTKGTQLEVRSDGGATATGSLDAVIPSADPATRRVPVEGLVANADGKLFAGTVVEVSLPARAEPGLHVPASALVTGEDPTVLVVGPDGVLVRRPVQVLRTEGEVLVVRAGLQRTDRVLANPGTAWRAGDKVPATTASR